MNARVEADPGLMRRRRCTAEHPFGTIKRMTAGGRFLTRGLNKVKAETALSDRAHGYFPMTTALGKVYTPRDMYYGTLLSSAEALHSGITTVHNWCHNIMTYEHAVEDLRAMQETGLRGRFSYGAARSTPLTQPFSVADLERMHGDWASLSNEAY
jgi:5-methylthioadenosine/S-adenosylhomocysteine deaminase